MSTTPEELYTRKIAAEEYGEAILLAQHYRYLSVHHTCTSNVLPFVERNNTRFFALLL